MFGVFLRFSLGDLFILGKCFLVNVLRNKKVLGLLRLFEGVKRILYLYFGVDWNFYFFMRNFK